jgi:hypothetical protein
MLVTSHLNFGGSSELQRPLLSSFIVPAFESEFGWNSLTKKIRYNNGTAVVDSIDSSDLSANTDFAIEPSKLATRDIIRQFVDNRLNSFSNFRGSHDASSGVFPTGTIKAGDYWYISVAGTLTGLTPVAQVSVGDMLVARVPNPTNASGWFVLQSNFDTSQDILVGGTFTPSAGTILGTDNIKTALQKLQGNITANILTAANGLSIVSGQARLGGALTLANTTISGTTQNLFFEFAGATTDRYRLSKNNVYFLFDTTGNNSGLLLNEGLFSYNGNSPSSSFQAAAGTTQLSAYNGGTFSMTSTDIFLNDIRATKKGIEYLGDYSLTYTARSLVDKAYVDNLMSGILPKEPVRVATTTNITLSGLQTIDTILLLANERVLVKNQTDAKQNGIYITGAGAWTRATDFDDIGSSAEVRRGSFVFVTEGTQGSFGYVVVSINADVVVGTDNINFIQVSQSTSYGFSNGLTLLSGIAKLGGALTENTILDGGGSFSFRGTGLSAFRMDASNSTMLLSGDSFTLGMGARGVSMDSSGQGFVYLSDLSATFINESLITKRYADTKAKFYSQNITLVANTPLTITHNLNLGNQNDCIVQLWVGNNLVLVDVTTTNVNALQVTSISAQTGRLVVIGR